MTDCQKEYREYKNIIGCKVALNSLQFNHVERAIQVKSQREMRWKLFGIVVPLYFLLLFVELKEKDYVEKEFGFYQCRKDHNLLIICHHKQIISVRDYLHAKP